MKINTYFVLCVIWIKLTHRQVIYSILGKISYLEFPPPHNFVFCFSLSFLAFSDEDIDFRRGWTDAPAAQAVSPLRRWTAWLVFSIYLNLDQILLNFLSSITKMFSMLG